MSSLINSVVTCVQQSRIWNGNARLCVVRQPLGARGCVCLSVCLVGVVASEPMTGGSEQPRRGLEQLAEAELTRVLCLLLGFTCLKAFQLFYSACSSRNA